MYSWCNCRARFPSALIYMQWWTMCIERCQLAIMCDKEIIGFCHKSSEKQAFCSRPSEESLQQTTEWICSLLTLNRTKCPCWENQLHLLIDNHIVSGSACVKCLSVGVSHRFLSCFEIPIHLFDNFLSSLVPLLWLIILSLCPACCLPLPGVFKPRVPFLLSQTVLSCLVYLASVPAFVPCQCPCVWSVFRVSINKFALSLSVPYHNSNSLFLTFIIKTTTDLESSLCISTLLEPPDLVPDTLF